MYTPERAQIVCPAVNALRGDTHDGSHVLDVVTGVTELKSALLDPRVVADIYHGSLYTKKTMTSSQRDVYAFS